MQANDCPPWLCNQWNVPHDYVHVLFFLLLIAPYIWLWRRVYRHHRKSLNSSLDYWMVFFLTQVSLFGYVVVLSAIGRGISGLGYRFVGNFMASVAFVAMLYLVFIFVVSLVVAILRAIVNSFSP